MVGVGGFRWCEPQPSRLRRQFRARRPGATAANPLSELTVKLEADLEPNQPVSLPQYGCRLYPSVQIAVARLKRVSNDRRALAEASGRSPAPRRPEVAGLLVRWIQYHRKLGPYLGGDPTTSHDDMLTGDSRPPELRRCAIRRRRARRTEVAGYFEYKRHVIGPFHTADPERDRAFIVDVPSGASVREGDQFSGFFRTSSEGNNRGFDRSASALRDAMGSPRDCGRVSFPLPCAREAGKTRTENRHTNAMGTFRGTRGFMALRSGFLALARNFSAQDVQLSAGPVRRGNYPRQGRLRNTPSKAGLRRGVEPTRTDEHHAARGRQPPSARDRGPRFQGGRAW